MRTPKYVLGILMLLIHFVECNSSTLHIPLIADSNATQHPHPGGDEVQPGTACQLPPCVTSSRPSNITGSC